MRTNIRTKAITYVATFVALFLGYYLLRDSTWQGSTQLHTLMEAVATLLALMVGISALVRFYTKKNNTFLFIGAGFLGTALLDGYHAVVTSQWFDQLWPSPPPHLIPWSWNASRFFLSILMLLSWWAWRREERLGAAGQISEKAVYAVVGVLTFLSFTFFAFYPLPRAYYPELIFGRPEEFFAATFFLLALIGYLRKGAWKTDAFEHWVVLSLIVGVMGQAMFMSFSFKLFDVMFDMAHLLKKVSYIFVLTGLLISMYYLFRQAEKSTKEVMRTNKALEKEVTERKRAEDQLREQTNQLNLANQQLFALHTVTATVSGSLDLDQVLAKALDTILEAIDMEAGFIRFIEGGSHPQLTLKVHRGISPAFVKKLQRGARSDGKTAEILSTKRTFVFDTTTLQTGTLRPETTIHEGFTAAAWVPIASKEKVVGILSVRTRKVETFPRAQIPLLESIGASIGVAIENANLYRESQRQWEIQKLLKELSQDITSLDIHSLLKKITEKMREVFRVDISDVRIIEKGIPHLLGVSGIEPERIQGTGTAQGRYRWILKYRRPLLIPDITKRTDLPTGQSINQLGIRGYLAVPLFTRGGEIIGMIRALTYEPHEFSQSEADLIQQLANGAAIAIENARLFEQTKKQAVELEMANSAKNEFLGVMSHELRTPLNTIVGLTQMVEEGMLGEINAEQEKALAKVTSRSRDLLGMITDILEATGIEAGAVKVEIQEVSLEVLFNELRSIHEVPMNKELILKWDYPSDLSSMKTDKEKLKHILQNLINNAIKFTNRGNVTISARRIPESKAVEFKVTDTGIGIGKEHLPYIFEMFRQADSSDTRPYGGSGVGLYIVKNFTDLLGGTVEVESEPGKGSTFTVTLPSKSA